MIEEQGGIIELNSSTVQGSMLNTKIFGLGEPIELLNYFTVELFPHA
jgi:hypothetical protein